ncbi:hypothetical protein [Variovorax defluvii]|uniref:hypothetical protein n=1 Tax=Variovorax defluvii TaxID=913761 RepID=UPI0031F069C7
MAVSAQHALRAPPHRVRREVFCYFDNDVKVQAPYDAAALAARLGLPAGLGPDGEFVPPPELAPLPTKKK